MSVDLRTRRDGDLPAVVPSDFFSTELPTALERSHGLITAGAARLRLRPLTIHCGDESWSLDRDVDTIRVRRGPASGGARLVLSIEDLTGLVHDQCTPMTFYVAGRLDMSAGGLPDFLDWWLVLRAALDRRALYVPGTVDFKDGDGGPLDLRRSFLPDDAGDEMSHFLHQAGFLHVRGVFEAGEMARISADMDRAAPRYRDGDGRSWWATVADGSRRLVRMQGFDEYSETTAGLLADERLLRLGDIPGDGHLHTGLEGNRIEALVKPLGVVQGISDVPWHKDCSLGRHSYECCSLTIGISVTAAGPTSGQLRVVAGSHRALVSPARVEPGSLDLPEVDLPTSTGDITMHLSCTLHMSQPPTAGERRVMYTAFRLPGVVSEETRAARARVRTAREASHVTVSQEPSTTT